MQLQVSIEGIAITHRLDARQLHTVADKQHGGKTHRLTHHQTGGQALELGIRHDTTALQDQIRRQKLPTAQTQGLLQSIGHQTDTQHARHRQRSAG